MERDKYFSSLLYSICKGLNSFFFSKTQKKIFFSKTRKKILSNDMSENMSAVSFSIIKSLATQTFYMVSGIDLKFTSALKYFHLCSRCMARYTLVHTHAQMTIWGAQNVRCPTVYAKILLGAQRNVYQDF